MGVIQAITSAFGGRQSRLPNGVTPQKFVQLSDALKPYDFRHRQEVALRFFRGQAQVDTLEALRRAFPLTSQYMTPVSVPVLKHIIRKQAAVFAGAPDFELVDDAGQPREDAGGVTWDSVVAAAQLHRHLQETNKLTRLCKRTFLRATWDAKCRSVKLALFTPDKVHVVFPPDSRDLNDAAGVLLEIEPALDVNGKLVDRWEFWSADAEKPQNFIIDAKGNEYGTLNPDGTLNFENPYRDEDDQPCVPLISFSDEDESVGYWLPPDQALVDAQRAIDVDETNLKHVLRTQAFGNWVTEVNPSEVNPGQWAGAPVRNMQLGGSTRADLHSVDNIKRGDGDMTIVMSPDTITKVPRGWTLKNIGAAAKITEMIAASEQFLKMTLTLAHIPPGEIFGETRGFSGYALEVERLPLTELRIDQIQLYAAPTEEMIELVRMVWDAHQSGNATRFGPCEGKFTPGELTGPVDPAVEQARWQFLLANRLATRADIIIELEGCTEEEAAQKVLAIDAETPARPPAANVAAALLNRPTPREQVQQAAPPAPNGGP